MGVVKYDMTEVCPVILYHNSCLRCRWQGLSVLDPGIELRDVL